MEFNENDYGIPIPKSLTDKLKRWTVSDDIRQVARNTGVSVSTIKYVMYGTNSLTKDNSKAIIELYHLAKINAKKKKQQAEIDFG